MSFRKMVGFYDFFSVFLAKPNRHFIVAAKAIDDDDPYDYPAIVYDINGNNIGVANSKHEFINLWNSNSTNSAAGHLTGWYGPFAFEFIAKETMDLKSDSQSEMDFVIDSDNEVITDSDGIYITN